MAGVLFSAEALAAACLLVAVAFVTLTVTRRRLIARDAELAVCTLATPGGTRPRTGMMRMTADRLEWYRLFGLTPRPGYRWPRRALEVGAPEPLTGESPAHGLMTSGVRVPVLIRGRQGPQEVVIVMAQGRYTAFRAWAEAAPSPFPLDG